MSRRKRNRKGTFLAVLATVAAGVLVLSLLAPLVQAAEPARPVVDLAHVAVTPDQTGTSLLVFTVLNVTNPGREPVGKLEIPLPAGFKDLTPIQAEGGPQVSDTGLLDPDGLGAGATKRLLFSYRLPVTDGKVEMVLSFPYPTEQFTLSLPKQGLEIQGEGLQDAGESQVDGVTWRRYTRADIPAGTRMALRGRVTGPPPAPGGGAAAPARTRPAEVDDEDVIGHKHGADTWKALGHLLVIVLAFALVVRGSVLPTRRIRPQDSRLHLDPAARALVREIAVLDLDHERGKVDGETYLRLRQRLKRDLLSAARF